MDTEILQINTIDSYNSLFGLETRHPLVRTKKKFEEILHDALVQYMKNPS